MKKQVTKDTKDNNTIERLTAVCEEFVNLSSSQMSQINQGMAELASEQKETSKKLGNLAEVIAKSEERHKKSSDDIQRIEINTKDLGKDFKSYAKNNDERVVELEKQSILQKQSVDHIKEDLEKKQNNRDKLVYGVIGSLTAL